MPKDSITTLHQPADLPPLKVTVAPNGARKTKRDHPKVPVTVEEIAATSAACLEAGAHELHLHVRDKDQKHSLDPGLYREAMSAVAEMAPGLQIQITTEAAGVYGIEAQFDTVKQLQPAAASVSVREMARDERVAHRMYGFAQEAGVHLQHILYDAEDIHQFKAWLANGVILPTQRDVLLVLGSYEPPKDAQPFTLRGLLNSLDDDVSSWTVCAFGPTEQRVVRDVLRMNGHVRVGFENNLHKANGELLRDNAESVSLIVQHATSIGRPLLEKVQVS
ncbi:3-keto-5-aminohexanoate cleavage protein [Shimia sp. MIT1388]|uniref:3-keto-5-aminohexanoate cleavage protein n=1 Tax=Shimia sp. MIT1388 TaxID=3096992 RepID=UPI00399A650E